ncbi:Cytochrome P450 hydroxylase [Rhizoctonia solani]|uniref:Cytochrome P450 hydroxylase n=1 Tax=Rhizoctonia solani TaxID=456999 RepID=A0A8H7IJY4_9AGAM|nr:Cytochrome P450 hydroxylase [Rhizoctonia solani]
MSTGSIAAVLGNIACFVLKYGTIWLALYFGRYLVTLWIVDPYRSYLRFLPGPPIDGRFVDRQLWDLQNPQLTPKLHEEYEKLYGKTIKFQGMAYFDQRLMTVDPVSINYMINRASDIFQKPWQTRRFIGSALNPFAGADNQGIFTTEGEMHRKLRRVIAPAFSYQSVKNLTPLFFHKSFELRDKLRSVLAVPQTVSRPGVEVEQFPGEPSPRVRMDLHNWIGRATFDIIGVAGFGYEFHSIQEETNTFYDAYRCMFNALRQVENKLHNLGLFFPSGLQTALIAAEKAAGATVGKDFVMLNLLLRSNEADSVYLTESEIIAQIDSIMFAGHDTTSMAIQWALWELTRYPPVQARLRAELAPLVPILKDFVPAGPSETGHKYADLTGELGDLAARLDALPYLEKFVREVLRFHPSVHSTFRVAMKDDIIPVSEPVRNQNGEISKAWGEFIHIPIEGMHLLKSVWGEDAHDFNPDRWDSLPAKVKASPGLYANLMSFSVGPNSCPASRWALVEIKVMLAVMIASFEFTGASPMSAHNFLVGRPYERNKFEKGKIDSLGYERSC